jgi:tetratricopeptide (TPR) repeat protein
MLYDCIVIKIGNDRLKPILARNIAHQPSMSLQKAQAIVEKPPFVFLKGLSIEEIKQTMKSFEKSGLEYKIIEQSIAEPSPMQGFSLPQSLQPDNSLPKVKATPIRRSISHPVIMSSKTTAEIKKPQFSKQTITTVIVLIVLILIPTLLIYYGTKKKEADFLTNYDSMSPATTPVLSNSKQKGKLTQKQSSKKLITNENKQKANNYVDSAQTYKEDYEQALKFYLIAISFNKYNYKAWHGLIETYKMADKNEKAIEAEKKMKELFGHDILTIGRVIEPYGILTTYSVSDDNRYVIEYHPESNGKEELTYDAYRIIKGVQIICNCTFISLFASSTSGKGLIVHVQDKNFFPTFESFTKDVSVTYLE